MCTSEQFALSACGAVISSSGFYYFLNIFKPYRRLRYSHRFRPLTVHLCCIVPTFAADGLLDPSARPLVLLFRQIFIENCELPIVVPQSPNFDSRMDVSNESIINNEGGG